MHSRTFVHRICATFVIVINIGLYSCIDDLCICGRKWKNAILFTFSSISCIVELNWKIVFGVFSTLCLSFQSQNSIEIRVLLFSSLPLANTGVEIESESMERYKTGQIAVFSNQNKH